METMRVTKENRVREWMKAYPDAAASLARWLEITLAAKWETLADVRNDFGHADPVTVASGKVVFVFNIAGNRYRLIAAIHYSGQRVYTLRFLTHAEYDKNRWKDEL